jgi:hypothetical protein
MRTLLSIAVMVTVLTGCGGSDDAATPAADTSPSDAATEAPATETSTSEMSSEASATGTTTGPTAGGTVASTGVEPCNLLTADEVADATGFEVVDVTPMPPVTCVYDLGEDVPVDIFVAVEDGAGRMAGAASIFDDYGQRARSGDTERVPGLGSIAYFDGNFRAVAVDAGDGRYFVVGVNGGFGELAEPRDTLIALADLAVDRL